MKLFRKIQKWFENQENLYYLFLIILIVPNIVLCFTEPMPLVAKVCNVLLPFSIYHMIMSWSGNCGKTFWILFPFLFFGAFQIVLLYLFGQSVIAVDMFLNLVTTNPGEALELLDNLIPAIIIVVLLYIPALVLAAVAVSKKRRLSETFVIILHLPSNVLHRRNTMRKPLKILLFRQKPPVRRRIGKFMLW